MKSWGFGGLGFGIKEGASQPRPIYRLMGFEMVQISVEDLVGIFQHKLNVFDWKSQFVRNFPRTFVTVVAPNENLAQHLWQQFQTLDDLLIENIANWILWIK